MRLLVCLNHGWSGPRLWARALAGEERVTFVYVVVPQVGMGRAVRRASRAIARARAAAAELGLGADEWVLRAPNVADGLFLAQKAMGGAVVLTSESDARRRELERRHVPVRAVRC
jgi:hypothetical protein